MVNRILADEVVLMPIHDLHPHPSNPRRGNVEAIRESIRAHGFVNPCLVQKTRSRILAGEHRWRAAKDEGYTEVPVILLDVDDDQAIKILLVDNKSADDSVYDQAVLAEVLREVAEITGDLIGTGWSLVEYESMLDSIKLDTFRDGEDRPDEGDEDDRGTLLGLVDVSVGEPRHEVTHGDVWRLGPHILVVADIMTEWSQWAGYLEAGKVFLPYPGAFIVLTAKALQVQFVMVQPNRYLAGHILDKWESVHGADTVSQSVSGAS